MILITAHCSACASGWLEAVSRLVKASSVCIFCGAAEVKLADHDHPHADLAARQAA